MKQVPIKNQDFELLRVGSNDKINLLSNDELGELVGGKYCSPLYCGRKYIDGKNGIDCPKRYCPGDYYR